MSDFKDDDFNSADFEQWSIAQNESKDAPLTPLMMAQRELEAANFALAALQAQIESTRAAQAEMLRVRRLRVHNARALVEELTPKRRPGRPLKSR